VRGTACKKIERENAANVRKRKERKMEREESRAVWQSDPKAYAPIVLAWMPF
jgi:hypothetical protein